MKTKIHREQHFLASNENIMILKPMLNLLKQIWLILATRPPYLLPFTTLIEQKITESKNDLICLGFCCK